MPDDDAEKRVVEGDALGAERRHSGPAPAAGEVTDDDDDQRHALPTLPPRSTGTINRRRLTDETIETDDRHGRNDCRSHSMPIEGRRSHSMRRDIMMMGSGTSFSSTSQRRRMTQSTRNITAEVSMRRDMTMQGSGTSFSSTPQRRRMTQSTRNITAEVSMRRDMTMQGSRTSFSSTSQRRRMTQSTRNNITAVEDHSPVPVPLAESRRVTPTSLDRSVMKSRWTLIRRLSNLEDPWRERWDLVVLLLIGVDCLATPYMGAFNVFISRNSASRGGRKDRNIDGKDDRLYLSLLVMTYVVDFLLLPDLLVQTISTVYDFRIGSLIHDSREIRRRYFRSRAFFCDALAMIPLELFALVAGSIHSHTFSLLRLTRLLRIERVFLVSRRWGRSIRKDSSVIGLFEVFISMCFVSHWFSCLWFWVAFAKVNKEDREDTAEEAARADRVAAGLEWSRKDTWLDAFACWESLGVEFLYVKSIYWAVMTITTVGYGDIRAISKQEHLTAIVVMLLAQIVFATVLGLMARLISSTDVVTQDFRIRVDCMQRYLSYREVPSQIIQRIERHQDITWSQTRGFDEYGILRDLPHSIHLDLAVHLYGEMIASVPLFAGSEPSFLAAVVMSLIPQSFPAGEKIVRKGDVGSEMFFVQRGLCEVINDVTGDSIIELRDGDFFGEVSLLCEARRSVTVRAVTEVDVLVLMKKALDCLFADYPKIAAKLKKAAASRKLVVAERLAKALLGRESKQTVDSRYDTLQELNSALRELMPKSTRDHFRKVNLQLKTARFLQRVFASSNKHLQTSCEEEQSDETKQLVGRTLVHIYRCRKEAEAAAVEEKEVEVDHSVTVVLGTQIMDSYRDYMKDFPVSQRPKLQKTPSSGSFFSKASPARRTRRASVPGPGARRPSLQSGFPAFKDRPALKDLVVKKESKLKRMGSSSGRRGIIGIGSSSNTHGSKIHAAVMKQEDEESDSDLNKREPLLASVCRAITTTKLLKESDFLRAEVGRLSTGGGSAIIPQATVFMQQTPTSRNLDQARRSSLSPQQVRRHMLPRKSITNIQMSPQARPQARRPSLLASLVPKPFFPSPRRSSMSPKRGAIYAAPPEDDYPLYSTRQTSMTSSQRSKRSSQSSGTQSSGTTSSDDDSTDDEDEALATPRLIFDSPPESTERGLPILHIGGGSSRSPQSSQRSR